MKSAIIFILALIANITLFSQSADKRYFELRTYYVHPGQLDAVVDRFKNHTRQVFEKMGMENIGYWVPANKDVNVFYYLLAYPDKNARKKSWEGFRADPEWTGFWANKKGTLVDSVQSVFLTNSGIVPAINTKSKWADCVFELRTYVCYPGRFGNLITRFKDHTTKIFENHQMENVVYFATDEGAGVQPRLVYLLAHENEDAAKKSWDSFRADPEWIRVRDASEKDGKIVEKVISVYLKPTDFSKLR